MLLPNLPLPFSKPFCPASKPYFSTQYFTAQSYSLLQTSLLYPLLQSLFLTLHQTSLLSPSQNLSSLPFSNLLFSTLLQTSVLNPSPNLSPQPFSKPLSSVLLKTSLIPYLNLSLLPFSYLLFSKPFSFFFKYFSLSFNPFPEVPSRSPSGVYSSINY